MNPTQPPLKPVMDLLEHVRENRVLQISGTPSFSVQSALNILSGLDNEQTLIARNKTRAEKIKHVFGWSPDPQYSVLREVDEAALNWAHNEGYFDRALHVHTAPPVPGLLNPVRITGADNILVVHSPSNGDLTVSSTSDPSCERLLMLFIQASHEYLHRHPFVLRQSGLSSDSEQRLNIWGLSVPAQSVDIGTYVLRKSFAEAYASMVLLVGANGSLESQKAVQALIQRNAQLSSTWDGNGDLFQHHMGNQSLSAVLDNWSALANRPSSEARVWIEDTCGALFGQWLNEQPLAEIVITEMIPNFEKRIIDLAHGNFHIENLSSSSPVYNTLNEVCSHLQSKWQDGAPHGFISRISHTIQRTGLAMGWMGNDTVLHNLSQLYETQRSYVCTGIVDEMKGITVDVDPTLRSRLEQYRKGSTPEPYVLPPIP